MLWHPRYSSRMACLIFFRSNTWTPHLFVSLIASVRVWRRFNPELSTSAHPAGRQQLSAVGQMGSSRKAAVKWPAPTITSSRQYIWHATNRRPRSYVTYADQSHVAAELGGCVSVVNDWCALKRLQLNTKKIFQICGSVWRQTSASSLLSTSSPTSVPTQ